MFKAVLHINRTADETYNYLVVPSRPFATQVGPFGSASNSSATVQTLVPFAAEDLLRQTKWQRTLRPSNVKPYVRVGFKPYCMVGTNGPATVVTAGSPTYYRPWEGRRWMPMSWVAGLGGTASGNHTTFFGPYVVRNNNVTGGDPSSTADSTFTATLTVYLQFRGQK